jgi:hypothetical protein
MGLQLWKMAFHNAVDSPIGFIPMVGESSPFEDNFLILRHTKIDRR